MEGALGRGAWQGRTLLTLALLSLLVFSAHSFGRGQAAHQGRSPLYPPLPAEAGSARLLALPPVSYGTAYTILETLPDGSPVTYDPCRPIHYVISSHHLPPYGVKMIREAVARASAASGLKFVSDGLTREPLSFQRASVQKQRYGDRWAPVLIAFSDAQESPDLGADVMGLGGSRLVEPDGPASARYVTGTVGLDQADFDRTLTYSNGWAMGRAAIMHELGHVLGLGHVQDGFQLMSEHNVGGVFYGPGDLAGLALEGSGRCHHDM